MACAWDQPTAGIYAELEGSNGQRGRVYGRAIFNDVAFLHVDELVEVRDTGVTRVEYAYYLIYDEIEIWAYERDPTHEPAVHRHDRGHAHRFPSEPISFKSALELAWETISHEQELRATTI